MAQLGVGISLPSTRQTTNSATLLSDSSGSLISSISPVCTGDSKTWTRGRTTTPPNTNIDFYYISGPAIFSTSPNTFTLTYTGIGPVLVIKVVSGIANSYNDNVTVADYGVNC